MDIFRHLVDYRMTAVGVVVLEVVRLTLPVTHNPVVDLTSFRSCEQSGWDAVAATIGVFAAVAAMAATAAVADGNTVCC